MVEENLHERKTAQMHNSREKRHEVERKRRRMLLQSRVIERIAPKMVSWKKRFLLSSIACLAVVLTACKDCEDCVSDECNGNVPCSSCADKCDGNDLTGTTSGGNAGSTAGNNGGSTTGNNGGGSSSVSSCAGIMVNGVCTFGCGDGPPCGEGSICCEEDPTGQDEDAGFYCFPAADFGTTSCPLSDFSGQVSGNIGTPAGGVPGNGPSVVGNISGENSGGSSTATSAASSQGSGGANAGPSGEVSGGGSSATGGSSSGGSSSGGGSSGASSTSGGSSSAGTSSANSSSSAGGPSSTPSSNGSSSSWGDISGSAPSSSGGGSSTNGNTSSTGGGSSNGTGSSDSGNSSTGGSSSDSNTSGGSSSDDGVIGGNGGSSSTSVDGWNSSASVCCVANVGCWTAEEASRLGIVCDVQTVPRCGDGILQQGEECDAGIRNGQIDSLCSPTCTSELLACYEQTCGCFTMNQPATDTIGQMGDQSEYVPAFDKYAPNARGGLGNIGLSSPTDIVTDTKHHLAFVADKRNNRVIVYELTTNNEFEDKQADFILGQPNFTTSTPGTSESKMNQPTSLAVDLAGNRLFVTDSGNHRVLVYTNVSAARFAQNTAADYVLGQPNFADGITTATDAQADNFYQPRGVSVSPRGYLFVADTIRNRVLRFDLRKGIQNGQAADAVLGQESFVSVTEGQALDQLSLPRSVLVDGDNVYVSDTGNHRVVIFKLGSIKTVDNSPLNMVLSLGNAGDLNLLAPQNMTANGNYLFVSDSLNNRIVAFRKNTNPNTPVSVTPEVTLGAPSFNTNVTSFPPIATTIRYPLGMVFVQEQCTLYAVDNGNNRILQFKNNGACSPATPTNASAKQSIICNLDGLCRDSGHLGEDCRCEDCQNECSDSQFCDLAGVCIDTGASSTSQTYVPPSSVGASSTMSSTQSSASSSSQASIDCDGDGMSSPDCK